MVSSTRGRINLLSLITQKPRVQAVGNSSPISQSGLQPQVRKWAERGHLGCLLCANHRLGAFIPDWSAVHLPSTLHSTNEEAEIRGEADWLSPYHGHAQKATRTPTPELRPKHQAQIWPQKVILPSCEISSLSSVQCPGF